MCAVKYQQPSSTTASNYHSTKNLPHLPKGVRVPKLHASDNTKPLPHDAWNEQEGDPQRMQLMAPGQQGGGGARRELQPFHAGASRSDQQTQGQEAPPIFASQPKRQFTFKRPTKVQQHIYRMSGGIEPVDLLCDRLYVWRLALKDLCHMFKNMIQVETKAASGYATANKALEIPFRESNHQFLQSGGIQDVWAAYRNYTIEKSMMHHEYVGYLKSAVVPSLMNLQQDIKNFVKSIEKDPCLRSSILYQSRQRADDMVNKLDNAIKYVYHSPDHIPPSEDPTLLNLGVIQTFKALYNDENGLHENVIQLQRETATVEQRIIGSVNIISKNWESFCLQHLTDSKTIVGKVTRSFTNIRPNSDWNEFVRRNQFQLVNEKAGYKTDDDMKYANQSNELCIPIKVNFLNRKNALRKWKEGLYILTPCGYLHGYKDAKHFETEPLSPELSIFLPHTTVSSTDKQAENLSFQISGRKKRALVGQKSFIFQANDESDLADWYSEAQQLSQINEQHETLDVEGVPPALPGMEPEEREHEYGVARQIDGDDQQNRLIDQGQQPGQPGEPGQQDQQDREQRGQKQQGQGYDNQQQTIDSSDDEDHYDNAHTHTGNNNLSTAAVLPDNMVSSEAQAARTYPGNEASKSPYSSRLQQSSKRSYSPLLQPQQNMSYSPANGVPKVMTEEGEKDATVTDQDTGNTSTRDIYSASSKQRDENDFVQRYNDTISEDEDMAHNFSSPTRTAEAR